MDMEGHGFREAECEKATVGVRKRAGLMVLSLLVLHMIVVFV